MQAVVDTLGLDLQAILWHTANYAVLLLCLWWIGFRPIMRKLAEREQAVRESLALADRARAEAAQAEAQRVALLTASQDEATTIVERARAEAQEILAAARGSLPAGGPGGADDARR